MWILTRPFKLLWSFKTWKHRWFWLIAVVQLPGWILHELSHLIVIALYPGCYIAKYDYIWFEEGKKVIYFYSLNIKIYGSNLAKMAVAGSPIVVGPLLLFLFAYTECLPGLLWLSVSIGMLMPSKVDKETFHIQWNRLRKIKEESKQ